MTNDLRCALDNARCASMTLSSVIQRAAQIIRHQERP